ncbi:MAG: zinc metallopeptidase [Planctomycetota bacterium]
MFFYSWLFRPEFWLIVGPMMAFGLFTSWRVKSVFKSFARVGVRTGMTGAQAAAAVAQAGGATGLTIEEHPGFLSDHYDPRARALRLSPEVYRGRSISSIAVAAHEAGHAIQHAKDYGPLGMRSKLVPVVTIGSQVWAYCVMAGFFFGGVGGLLLDIGIICFFLTALFQLVTLPVEFDASRRAKAVLASTGIVTTSEEAKGVEKVLGAAAMTYVAGLLTAVAQLIFLLVLRSQSDD